MIKVDDLKNIAVLIDADNAQLTSLEAIFARISLHGRIVVKKAYGDWKNPILKNWEVEIKRLAINPEQQFAYTTGKNASDISLVIGAMDLLNRQLYDAFVLISSDSDFTPLVIRLRESGVYVFGVGNNSTPEAFRKACDDFILTENLLNTDIEIKKIENKENTENITTAPVNSSKANIEEIHNLLKIAYDNYQDEEIEGYANVSSASAYIKRTKPDYSPLNYGFSKLPDLLSNFPEKYEIKRFQRKGTTIVGYKLLVIKRNKLPLHVR